MSKVILVTGTDTGVGKTVVSCALLRAMRTKGMQPVPVKPVETGCEDLEQPEDAIALSQAAGGVALEVVCPARYHLPAAPATAARREGARHSFAGLVAHVHDLQQRHSWVVVEGAGGLLVPLTDGRNFADFAVALGAGVVVVARDALGTINHTSLTIEAAQRRGIRVLAVVLNAGPIRDAAFVDHGAELRALWPTVPILGPIGRMRNPQSISMSEEVSVSKLLDIIYGI
jgi:dethiobiotin synthetase